MVSQSTRKVGYFGVPHLSLGVVQPANLSKASATVLEGVSGKRQKERKEKSKKEEETEGNKET